jgi:redox-regulated HSP33 family molecular chaperone
MSKAKTYKVANKVMTVKEIETATGVSAGKIRIQLTVKGVTDIKKAVENASSSENAKAVNKLFGTVKAKSSKTSEERVIVDIMAGTYMMVRRAENTDKFHKGTIQVFKGTKANPKCAIKESVSKFLKSVIAEMNLPIALEHSKKSSLNTRQLAGKVMNALS